MKNFGDLMKDISERKEFLGKLGQEAAMKVVPAVMEYQMKEESLKEEFATLIRD